MQPMSSQPGAWTEYHYTIENDALLTFEKTFKVAFTTQNPIANSLQLSLLFSYRNTATLLKFCTFIVEIVEN